MINIIIGEDSLWNTHIVCSAVTHRNRCCRLAKVSISEVLSSLQ